MKKKKKKKIHEIKYYILYEYKSAVEAIVSNFFINLKDQQINDITFVRNSAIPTKYGTVD